MKKKKKFNKKIYLVSIILIALILILFRKTPNPSTQAAEKIAEIVLDDHPFSIATNGVVNESKLKEFRNMDYEELKKSMNAKGDFCIYIEDIDGNLILEKGSSELQGKGAFCGG